jgi:hypothetical protein
MVVFLQFLLLMGTWGESCHKVSKVNLCSLTKKECTLTFAFSTNHVTPSSNSMDFLWFWKALILLLKKRWHKGCPWIWHKGCPWILGFAIRSKVKCYSFLNSHRITSVLYFVSYEVYLIWMRFMDICSTCKFILDLQQFCMTYSSQSGIGILDIVRLFILKKR